MEHEGIPVGAEEVRGKDLTRAAWGNQLDPMDLVWRREDDNSFIMCNKQCKECQSSHSLYCNYSKLCVILISFVLKSYNLRTAGQSLYFMCFYLKVLYTTLVNRTQFACTKSLRIKQTINQLLALLTHWAGVVWFLLFFSCLFKKGISASPNAALVVVSFL